MTEAKTPTQQLDDLLLKKLQRERAREAKRHNGRHSVRRQQRAAARTTWQLNTWVLDRPPEHRPPGFYDDICDERLYRNRCAKIRRSMQRLENRGLVRRDWFGGVLGFFAVVDADHEEDARLEKEVADRRAFCAHASAVLSTKLGHAVEAEAAWDTVVLVRIPRGAMEELMAEVHMVGDVWTHPEEDTDRELYGPMTVTEISEEGVLMDDEHWWGLEELEHSQWERQR